jgi:hypothetical protein
MTGACRGGGAGTPGRIPAREDAPATAREGTVNVMTLAAW